jgi:hypothetical protein
MLNRSKSRLTYANVMASIAVFAILAGGVAWASGKIGTKDLKRGAVTGAKIAKRAVGSAKLKESAVGEGNLKDGAVTAQKLAPSLASDTASFAAAAFVPVEDSTHNNMGSSVCGNFVQSHQGGENKGDLNAKTGSFLASVQLPGGATVKGLRMYANDNSSEDAHLYLVRKQVADGLSPQFDGYQVIANANTSGAVNNVMRAFDAQFEPVAVDNQNYYYYLELVVCDAIEPFTAQIGYDLTG